MTLFVPTNFSRKSNIIVWAYQDELTWDQVIIKNSRKCFSDFAYLDLGNFALEFQEMSEQIVSRQIFCFVPTKYRLQ